MIYNCSIWNTHCLLNKVLIFFSYSAVSSLSGMNHGTVTKKAFVWFWIRNRMPPVRLWKRCMELAVTNNTGELERHFVDPETGTVHEVDIF